MHRPSARARLAPRTAGALFAVTALCGAIVSACGTKQRAPGLFEPADPNDTGIFGDSGPDPKFDAALDVTVNCSDDAAGVCACKAIGQKPTSLYIVLDRSGSMREIVPPAKTSKWDVVRVALTDPKVGVLRKLGSRIALGAARFPGAEVDGCAVGSQVLDLRLGSKTTYDVLASILSSEVPAGGTPTASTLVAMTPTLKKLPAPAFVVLTTDGGPNCGTSTCGASRCIPNIERASYSGGVCDDRINCCDPTLFRDGFANCLDSDATKAAVAELASAGIKVFVVGVPGTEVYAKDLDQLAIAGGTARDSVPRYYAASDPASLTAALAAIAAKVIDSCVVTLEGPVTDPGITNVLLDSDLVPQDPVDGWSWTDDTHSAVRLNGTSCARVDSGGVTNVQVAVGCKTITR